MRRLCDLLCLNRSTLYYKEKPLEINELDLLNAIRDVWVRRPFYGYRRITAQLRADGIKVNRKCVARLMNVGGIKAIFPGPNTSRRNQLHKVHPLRLSGQ